MANTEDKPAWVLCDMCEDYICTIHELHVYDCDCPCLEEWGDIDPYFERPVKTITKKKV